jgi:hypothetical protein
MRMVFSLFCTFDLMFFTYVLKVSRSSKVTPRIVEFESYGIFEPKRLRFSRAGLVGPLWKMM